MQRIVINKCYGGFELSQEALLMLATLKNHGTEPYIYVWEHCNAVFPCTKEKFLADDMGPYIFLADPVPMGTPAQKCVEKDLLYNAAADESPSSSSLHRDDPDLVSVVEQLGDRASGQYSHLVIIEVPDDVKWTLTDYDGWEKVEEVHRTWG